MRGNDEEGTKIKGKAAVVLELANLVDGITVDDGHAAVCGRSQVRIDRYLLCHCIFPFCRCVAVYRAS